MERSKMNRMRFSYYRLGISATATLLAACGGSQPPIAALGEWTLASHPVDASGDATKRDARNL
jgi:hypothetical protein